MTGWERPWLREVGDGTPPGNRPAPDVADTFPPHSEGVQRMAPMPEPMKMLAFLPLLAISASLAAISPVDQRRDQDQAWAALRQGRILRLPEIERRVLPIMAGAQYLGVEFDQASAVYTLKFLRDGTVIWVEVDGRSGAIIGRTGR